MIMLIVVIESFDHSRVVSMSCLQKVAHKIEHMHAKTYENVYVWSDRMGSPFRSRYVFKLLASTALPRKTLSWYYNERHYGKGPMDGTKGTVKNRVWQNLFRQFTPYTYLKTEIINTYVIINTTAQKMKFSITDFFNKCDQIRSFLRIWSHLLKKSVMQNFIFCAVYIIWKENVVRMAILTSVFSKLWKMNILFSWNYLWQCWNQWKC